MNFAASTLGAGLDPPEPELLEPGPEPELLDPPVDPDPEFESPFGDDPPPEGPAAGVVVNR